MIMIINCLVMVLYVINLITATSERQKAVTYMTGGLWLVWVLNLSHNQVIMMIGCAMLFLGIDSFYQRGKQKGWWK